MRFIHISDVHLGKNFSIAQYGADFAKQRRQELLKTLARVIDFANKNKVDFILCSGDFLNGEELRVEELRNINSVIDRLERAPLVLTAGNHDPLGEKSPYLKFNWTDKLCLTPSGFGRMPLQNFNTVIHYYSWDTKEISCPLLEQAEFSKNGQYNIFMLHGDNRAQSNYLPFNVQQLEEQEFDYVALGHIHNPCCVGKNIYYSGSLEPLDFGETGQHGFMLCDILGGWSHFRFVPFACREYVEFTLEVEPGDSEISIGERIEKNIIRENPQNIYTVRLTGYYPPGSPFRIQRIRENLQEKEYCCIITDITKPNYDLTQIYRENRGNLIGDFISSFGLPTETGGRFPPESLSEVEQKALQYGVEAMISQKETS